MLIKSTNIIKAISGPDRPRTKFRVIVLVLFFNENYKKLLIDKKYPFNLRNGIKRDIGKPKAFCFGHYGLNGDG